MPESWLLLPLTLGLGVIDQAVPFHDSTKVWLRPLVRLYEYPTAVQFVGRTQDAPRSKEVVFPLGLGLGIIDQTLPFHDSTKVCEMPLVSVLESPTAVQFAALTQDAPWRKDSVFPLPGLGVGMIDQTPLFHDSTKVWLSPLVRLYEYPTAVQFAALTQDAPWSKEVVLPLGLGLGIIDQTLPFHDSTKVCERPLLSVLEYPTAVQFAALTQDTAWSTDSVLPLGLGLGIIDQTLPFHDSTKVW